MCSSSSVPQLRVAGMTCETCHDTQRVWNGLLQEMRGCPDCNDGGEGCTCQQCGKKYRVDVSVTDDLWDRIRPAGKPLGAGLLCGVCIFTKIEQLGEFSVLRLSLP